MTIDEIADDAERQRAPMTSRQREMLTAVATLDEAERLMTCSYMGTERWSSELAAWKKDKAVLIDCQNS